METIRYVLQDGIATLTFDEPNAQVNTMSLQWLDDLAALTAQMLQDQAAIKGMVLASAKSTFFAGADLKAVMRLKQSDALTVFIESELLKSNFRKLEMLGKPIVACLNGTALGGGWEVALLGHHRIAINDPQIQFGLPEVTLGLMPCAGGVTKMTRQLGLLGAQPYLVVGKTFSPQTAQQLGFVHALVAPGANAAAEMRAQALAWILAHPTARHPWEDKDYKVPGGRLANPLMPGMLVIAPALLKKQTRGLLPAPEAILACMVEGLQVDLTTALRIESRYLAQLMAGPNARAMVNTFFFNLNAIKSGQARPGHSPRYQPAKVGVLGADLAGAGIAFVQASRGIVTVLKDVSREKAEAGKEHSATLAQRQVTHGRMSAADQAPLLARIHATDQVADLKDCDLIIEALFEQRELKAHATQEAEPMLAQGGFFATNTASMPIGSLALASAHADKFVGIHFFNPVEKMKLVEIIRGPHTSDDTVARAFDYALAIGKLPIVVNDSRGFFTSRVFGTFLMEGIAMLDEGIAGAAIENAGIQCGMPVGPLAALDETTLTLCLQVLALTRGDLAAEGKTGLAPAGELLLERMVTAYNRPGRAGGAGFYDYPTEKGAKKHLWPQLKPLFEKADVRWDITDLKDRLLYRQAIETARCLSENVLTSVAEANIGSIFGIGFPAWTGGALQFIYGMGLAAFVKRADALALRFGAGFTLSDEVKAALARYQPSY